MVFFFFKAMEKGKVPEENVSSSWLGPREGCSSARSPVKVGDRERNALRCSVWGSGRDLRIQDG